MACFKCLSVHGISELAVLIWRWEFGVLYTSIQEAPASSCSAALPSVIHNAAILHFLTNCVSILIALVFCKCSAAVLRCLCILHDRLAVVSQGNLEEGTT